MVVPLPPTLLPPHPCLSEPPVDVVKDALPYRTALRCLVGLHCLLVIAFFISPSPHLAFYDSVSIFLGLMACHSTMPLRYNLYAIFTLFVCLSSLIRFADRVTLPEFGYSHSYRVLQLAQAIDAIVEAETDSPNVVLRFIGQQEQPLVAKNETAITPHELREILRMLQKSSSARNDKTQAEGAALNSFLQGKLVEQKKSERSKKFSDYPITSLEPDTSQWSFLDSQDTTAVNSIQRIAPTFPGVELWPSRKYQDLKDFQSITGYSFTEKSSSEQRSIKFSKDKIQEFLNFRPAVWRSTLEMVTLGLASLVTGFSTILAFVTGRKIERQVNVSIARVLGIDSESMQDSTTPLVRESSSELLPGPYLHDPMGERAVAYRPFVGHEVTLEGWSAQSEEQQGPPVASSQLNATEARSTENAQGGTLGTTESSSAP